MNLNLITPICSTGYGRTGIELIKSLTEQGHSIALWPIGGIELDSQDDVPIFQKCINNVAEYDINAPCVRIWHQFSLDQFVGKEQHVGFPIFELTRFRPVELHHMSCCDRLFVTSSWAKQIVINSLPGLKVDIVPLGVNNQIFYPANKHSIETTDNKDRPYVFFNCGKAEIRKGHDILIDAFNKAFTPEDNVELWMMFSNPFLTSEQMKQWIDLYKNSKLGNKIVILDRCDTHHQVAGIMRQTDCGVFPSRAEGWNLELLEMLSCGKPCIATNYSSHTEYCVNDNSYLIDIDELQPAHDGKWFFGQGNWAKIDNTQIDQCIEYMRYCYKNRISTNPAGLETAKQFSWQNSAKTLINYFS